MPVRRISKYTAIVPLGELGGLRIEGAPWWLIFCLSAMAFLLYALWLARDCLRAVFPQESGHRLAWWRDRRKARVSGA